MRFEMEELTAELFTAQQSATAVAVFHSHKYLDARFRKRNQLNPWPGVAANFRRDSAGQGSV
jgi:hypothetical protein